MTPAIDRGTERALVGALIVEPRHLALVAELTLADFGDPQARLAYKAIRNVEAAGAAIAPTTVRAEIERDTEHADHRWLDVLLETADPGKPDAIVAGWAQAVARQAAARRKAATSEPARPRGFDPRVGEDLEAELLAYEDERAIPSPLDEDAPRVGMTDENTHPADRFQLVKSGPRVNQPANTRYNVAIACRRLGIQLCYDEFAEQKRITGLDGFGPVIDDNAITRLWLTIEERFSFKPDKHYFHDAISDICRESSFHPVRDYLAGLTWDGTERISKWLVDYFGADDTEYTRAVSRIVLIAAVRRVREPGCKFDEMLILESEQGTAKSSALKLLAVTEDWFGDDLQLGADTRRFMEQTAGKWIVEAGELKGMTRGDVAALKATLSRQIDEARLAYGRENTRRARQFVVIGTTNDEAYLRDTTGNRRFWPVKVGRVDLERLRTDRDQLWAEAAAAEAAGESIRLAESLWGHAAVEQDARR